VHDVDPEWIRRDFPLLRRESADRPVYFDNACMTLKPQVVIDRILEYYTETPVCAGRSVHRLANRVTLAVDESRAALARLVNADAPERIAFTKNATEAINHVAWCLPLQRGAVVLTSDKEHNSNLVPHQRRAQLEGTRHAVFPTASDGAFDIESFKAAVSRHRGALRLVSVAHVSNLDGQAVPVREIVEIAHDAGARVLLDAAQSVPSTPVDVIALGVDYAAWSVHKMMGPTGIGCLYGTEEAFNMLEPRYLGGSTVATTRLDGHELLAPPQVFEAGLQDYAGILGAGAAAEYLMQLGVAAVHEHIVDLNAYLTRRLVAEAGVVLRGPHDAMRRGGILTFRLSPLDPHDVALYLDEAANVALRSGAHCVHSHLNARGEESGWARASLYAYNTRAECDIMAEALVGLRERLEAAA
jgi:cysteine desulfurase / selenocysteine lyase